MRATCTSSVKSLAAPVAEAASRVTTSVSLDGGTSHTCAVVMLQPLTHRVGSNMLAMRVHVQ